jgi:membrane fusion protein, heavy metal efflux system
MDIHTDLWRRLAFGSGPALLSIAVTSMVLLAGCDAESETEAVEPESWSVTAWGERYEVFPEVDPLVAGEAAPAHTHVTVLDGFSPLTEGTVEIVLRGPAGEQTFDASEAVRPGIFNIAVASEAAGEFELLFRIRSPAGEEEIRGGAVRVGDREAPGGLVRAPAPRAATDGGQPQPFLKEQQWRTAFATDWVRRGTMAMGARGLARVRSPAGGEAILTATVDGVVQPSPWPYPGQQVGPGDTIFRVAPTVRSDRSLTDLAAEAAGLEADAAAARARLARLEDLLAMEATSRREVEDARARSTTLEAKLQATRRDLESATAAREGKADAAAHPLRAPFSGRVAAVTASPGAAIAAGEPLARIVRNGPVWLEVSLTPDDTARLAAQGVGGLVLGPASETPRRVEAAGVRLVSLAPEVDPATGKVTALLEVDDPQLILGVTVEAEVLLGGRQEGIVVPTSALVDDGGVIVVYLQQSGESFARQEVEVMTRQGDLALVEGLVPGQRLVTRGGDAIRRAGLVSSGPPEGHVH